MKDQKLPVLLLTLFVALFSVACTGTSEAARPPAAPTVQPAAIATAADTPVPPAATALPPTAEPDAEPAAETAGALLPADPERGRLIFENGGAHERYEEQYYCTRCHSLDGSDGDGPTLGGIALAAGERVPGLSAEEYIRQSIMEPSAYVIEGYDISMGRIFSNLLSEQEVNDLVAYLLTQDEVRVKTAADQVEHGQEIFMTGGTHELYKPEYACAYCHSLDGTVGDKDYHGPSLQGIAGRAGDRVPGLSAEEYIRQSVMDPAAYITEGYSNKMGKVASKLLTEEEFDDLVAFLLTLQ